MDWKWLASGAARCEFLAPESFLHSCAFELCRHLFGHMEIVSRANMTIIQSVFILNLSCCLTPELHTTFLKDQYNIFWFGCCHDGVKKIECDIWTLIPDEQSDTRRVAYYNTSGCNSNISGSVTLSFREYKAQSEMKNSPWLMIWNVYAIAGNPWSMIFATEKREPNTQSVLLQTRFIHECNHPDT